MYKTKCVAGCIGRRFVFLMWKPMNKIVTAGVIVALSFQLIAIGEGTEPSDKPNVLMICIDDLNDWVGFLGGHPDAVTPHMDALAKRSRNFTNAHCNVPVCSASRASVMSGVAVTTHGSYELGPKYEELPGLSDVPTIQRYFKDNGYYTLLGGKVLHHGFNGGLAAGIDRSLGRKRSPRPPKPLNRPSNWSGAWDWGAYPEEDVEMADFQLANSAAQTLQEDFDQPFFMSVGFFRPHVPLFVPPRWFELYYVDILTLPRTQKSPLNDIPNNFLGINDYAAAPTHAQVVEHGKQRSLTHAYLASISFVDHCVGMVVDALNSSPHADNTLIVLWSDHGFHLGEKQHWGKRTLWQESTRVPLLFAGSAIKSGEVCPEPASLIDIYPTLIELCKLAPNPKLEGLSLVPQLYDPTTRRERPAITSSYFGNHSIRSRDWRLISYNDGAQELYDHRTDADEFHNLADDPAHHEILDRLVRWLPKQAAAEFKVTSERARVRGK
jgi:arylsulfatase A-like enzyme